MYTSFQYINIIGISQKKGDQTKKKEEATITRELRFGAWRKGYEVTVRTEWAK